MRIKKGSRILKLTLKEPWFSLELSGDKPFELRDYGNAWIMSRLFDKDNKLREYDYILYTNGYGNHRPYFICKFSGVVLLQFTNIDIRYGNKIRLQVGYKEKKLMIINGPIVKRGNIKKV